MADEGYDMYAAIAPRDREDGKKAAIPNKGPPSQCSKSTPQRVSMGRCACRHGRSTGSPSRLGGADALVARWRRRVLSPGAGVDDERSVGARWGLDGLFEQSVEEHAPGS